VISPDLGNTEVSEAILSETLRWDGDALLLTLPGQFGGAVQ
jgi:hypothetical protein